MPLVRIACTHCQKPLQINVPEPPPPAVRLKCPACTKEFVAKTPQAAPAVAPPNPAPAPAPAAPKRSVVKPPAPVEPEPEIVLEEDTGTPSTPVTAGRPSLVVLIASFL